MKAHAYSLNVYGFDHAPSVSIFPPPVPTPFGVGLRPVRYTRFVPTQRVSAPLMDGSGARIEAEVVTVGTRTDREGNWYLLRDLRHDEPGALLPEEVLIALPHPQRDMLIDRHAASSAARFAS